MFSQYGQDGLPIHPSTTRVFEGLAEGGVAALKGEEVGKEVGVRMRRVILVVVGQCVADLDPVEDLEGVTHEVGVRVVERLRDGERVNVSETVPVGDTEKGPEEAVQMEAPAAEVIPLGQGTHVALEEAPTAELLVPAGHRVALMELKGQ